MLDNLVESKSNFENNKRRGSYLVTTGFLVFSLFASGICWSLFARDLNIGSESMELSSLIPPVPMPVDEPPVPEPIKQTKQDNSPKTEDNQFVRKDNIARTDEPIAPKDVSTSPTNVVARPNAPFKIGPSDTNPEGNPSNVSRGEVGNNNNPGGIAVKTREVEKEETEEPPPAKKTEPKVERPKNTVVSKGVINGTAISLPKPPYPPTARAVRAGGDVNVQVTIDENGNVISANAISGHALLRGVSETAARNAKFKPTLLSGSPVKVTGVIVYKFAPQ